MHAITPSSLATFVVDVDFFCEGERYGTETYTITAASGLIAEREALERSICSIYDDDRIPDRSRRAAFRAG